MLWYVVAATFFLWLIALTYFVFKTRRHYFGLLKRTRKNTIDEILDSLLEDDKNLQHETAELKKELKEAIDRSRFYFQKAGVVRFNAFGRAGSDQSFALALLDKEDNGLIINFIYTHDGVRVYTKKIKQGKGDYQLSEEEERAIKESK